MVCCKLESIEFSVLFGVAGIICILALPGILVTVLLFVINNEDYVNIHCTPAKSLNPYEQMWCYTGNKTKGAVYPFGIYNDKKPVGFLLLAYDYSEVCDDPEAPEIAKGNYFLWRIMIDKRYQGRGYGKEAVKLALDFIKTFPHGKAKYCWICYDKENEVARKLYLSVGFKEIGEQGSDINAVIEV